MRRTLLGLLVAALLGAVGVLAPGAQAAQRPLQIYPLGDSITYGTSFPASTPGGYRGVLHALLDAEGVPHAFVGAQNGNPSPLLTRDAQDRHDGHPGYLIDQVTRGLTGASGGGTDGGGRWLLGRGTRAPISPDVVLVHLGTNDIIRGYDPGTRYPTGTGKPDLASPQQRALFVAHMTGRLRTLLDTLHRYRPRATVVVATVLPIGFGACDPVTPEYARSVQRLVEEQRAAGRPVRVADAFAAFADIGPTGCTIRPGMLSDTVHPTAAGYALLGRVFEGAMQAR
ncbi:MAG: GDSL-type esterase/lipase family protein [Actinobacteria bacterium]|nr:GDSL-type esterase/lipase family protein [Actinomycetota bacterium]MCA1720819.1 GDSL-type esterase/lipase family protein [Actinomycetota bacterium]